MPTRKKRGNTTTNKISTHAMHTACSRSMLAFLLSCPLSHTRSLILTIRIDKIRPHSTSNCIVSTCRAISDCPTQMHNDAQGKQARMCVCLFICWAFSLGKQQNASAHIIFMWITKHNENERKLCINVVSVIYMRCSSLKPVRLRIYSAQPESNLVKSKRTRPDGYVFE